MLFIKIKKWFFIRIHYRIMKLLILIIFRFKIVDEVIQAQREKLSDKVYQNYHGVVAFGAFRGLILDTGSAWSGSRDTGAKILGLYENQILDWLKDKKFDLFIDIGAADGYYAAGMLISKKAAHAVTFEISIADQAVTRSIAAKNEILDKIEIKGKATEGEILSVIQQDKDGLVLMDIEGEEFNLISERILQSAKNYSFIIELHEIFDVYAEQKLLELLRKFHFVEIIYGLNRNFPKDPFLLSLTDNERVLLLSEGRQSGMKWICLSPRVN